MAWSMLGAVQASSYLFSEYLFSHTSTHIHTPAVWCGHAQLFLECLFVFAISDESRGLHNATVSPDYSTVKYFSVIL